MQVTHILLLAIASAVLTNTLATSPLFFSNLKLPARPNDLKIQSSKPSERERDKAYTRQQFNKNFSELQVTGQKLLKEHELKRLTSSRLANDAQTINKRAKALRTLIALGDLAAPLKTNKEIDTPEDFDQTIRLLAKHIWDFAHNPIHQNSKVFNTNQAQKAQTDLLAVIDLSKALEKKAKKYVPLMARQ